MHKFDVSQAAPAGRREELQGVQAKEATMEELLDLLKSRVYLLLKCILAGSTKPERSRGKSRMHHPSPTRDASAQNLLGVAALLLTSSPSSFSPVQQAHANELPQKFGKGFPPAVGTLPEVSRCWRCDTPMGMQRLQTLRRNSDIAALQQPSQGNQVPHTKWSREADVEDATISSASGKQSFSCWSCSLPICSSCILWLPTPRLPALSDQRQQLLQHQCLLLRLPEPAAGEPPLLLASASTSPAIIPQESKAGVVSLIEQTGNASKPFLQHTAALARLCAPRKPQDVAAQASPHSPPKQAILPGGTDPSQQQQQEERLPQEQACGSEASTAAGGMATASGSASARGMVQRRRRSFQGFWGRLRSASMQQQQQHYPPAHNNSNHHHHQQQHQHYPPAHNNSNNNQQQQQQQHYPPAHNNSNHHHHQQQHQHYPPPHNNNNNNHQQQQQHYPPPHNNSNHHQQQQQHYPPPHNNSNHQQQQQQQHPPWRRFVIQSYSRLRSSSRLRSRLTPFSASSLPTSSESSFFPSLDQTRSTREAPEAYAAAAVAAAAATEPSRGEVLAASSYCNAQRRRSSPSAQTPPATLRFAATADGFALRARAGSSGAATIETAEAVIPAELRGVQGFLKEEDDRRMASAGSKQAHAQKKEQQRQQERRVDSFDTAAAKHRQLALQQERLLRKIAAERQAARAIPLSYTRELASAGAACSISYGKESPSRCSAEARASNMTSEETPPTRRILGRTPPTEFRAENHRSSVNLLKGPDMLLSWCSICPECAAFYREA
ncbi:leucine rich repeat containing protein ankyrin repeat containing protein [Cyclospora cayetanensis]|uniref:Leucine rich repeat containing protein ankyrin repeat containing protein n=1 Tax=Cyclospora cayetanensis TaxID=88456 RepID=A0A1D3D367_9EIME|nr:leucine rich repeat containing protein ankyrin repeat containing protein [Cyclospora cayetanensis]